MNRRDFTQGLFGTILSFSLLETIIIQDAFAQPVKPIINHWVKELQEMSLDLKTRQITPLTWQAKIKELYNRVNLEDLLKFIDFQKLTQDFPLADLGVKTRVPSFPQLAGLPSKLAFHKKIFGMRKNRAIIPHGHKNMVSCHLVLKGSLHVRHYDKVEEEMEHLIIRPSIDTIGHVGSHSSISDDENNVHWMIALSEPVYTFDVIITDLGKEAFDIHNIDIDQAENISGNLLRAPKLDVDSALKKYGKVNHH